MKISLICPVRGITNEEKEVVEKYVLDLEQKGHKVHWPPRDTNQDDPVGLRICQDNRQAIKEADEIHIWWNKKSEGSLFDFGMVFGLEKRIVLINPESVIKTPTKSFNNVLLTLAQNGGN